MSNIDVFLTANHQKMVLNDAESKIIGADFTAQWFFEKEPPYNRLQLKVQPHQTIHLQSVYVEIGHAFQKDDAVFCNGFQSWSESRLYRFDEKLDRLRKIAYPLMYRYGDYHLNVPHRKGLLHSWTYTYIQSPQANALTFMGSLDEKKAFTRIDSDIENQVIVISKEVQGMIVTEDCTLLDILWMDDVTEDIAFDTYFKLSNISPPKAPPATGWTSWYNYYNKISQTIMDKNLAAFAEKQVAIDFFQIDDGWQTRIGDWLSIQPSFPKGMKHLAQSIQNQGFKAGLWLAPFIVERKSQLFQEHPDWVLRDDQGKMIPVGYSPLWSGRFYALDFYHPEVRAYLVNVFEIVLNEWGFDMVKLDFLYAVCVEPRHGKARGQVMYEAMVFLRELVGEKYLLGCGVPLSSAFGLVDYCRIGADIHLKWEHGLLKFLRNRERVSTIVALRTTIGRRHLNGRAFQNDPDVFILREKNHQLTPIQQDTILMVNLFFGSLLFCSDDISDYDIAQLKSYEKVFNNHPFKIYRVTQIEFDVYKIEFLKDKSHHTAYFNLNNKQLKINDLVLNPFETKIL